MDDRRDAPVVRLVGITIEPVDSSSRGKPVRFGNDRGAAVIKLLVYRIHSGSQLIRS
jgi:hypothetical protein